MEISPDLLVAMTALTFDQAKILEGQIPTKLLPPKQVSEEWWREQIAILQMERAEQILMIRAGADYTREMLRTDDRLAGLRRFHDVSYSRSILGWVRKVEPLIVG